MGIALEATIPTKRGPDLGIDPSAEAAIFCDEAIHPASLRRSAFGEASAPDLPDTHTPQSSLPRQRKPEKLLDSLI